MNKKILILCTAFLLAAVPSAFAVNDLLAPKGEEGAELWTHLVKPSMRTRLQHDDNVTSSKPKDSSWGGIFGPKVGFKLPYEHSYVGADAEYVGRYYTDRLGGDSADNDVFVDTAMRHDISDRLSFGLKQYFA